MFKKNSCIQRKCDFLWYVSIFLHHFAFPYLKVRNGVGLSTFFWAVATPVPASLSHPIPSETVKCYIGGDNVYLESRGPRNGVHKTQNMVKLKSCSASFAVAAGALSCLPTTLACWSMCSGAASVCLDNLVTTWWLVVPQSTQKYLKVPRNTSKYP